MEKNKGFSLTELMISVTIVGIIIALAVPAYQDYVVRSQVADGLSLASDSKIKVEEYYANNGIIPMDKNDLEIAGKGKYVSNLELINGKLVATFGENANKQIIGESVTLFSLESNSQSNNLQWNCESTIDNKYLPTSCVSNKENSKDISKDLLDKTYYYNSSGYKIENGIIYMNGYELSEYDSINPDGSINFIFDQHGQYRTFTLNPDGSMENSIYYYGTNQPLQTFKNYPIEENGIYEQQGIVKYYKKTTDENGSEIIEEYIYPDIRVKFSPEINFDSTKYTHIIDDGYLVSHSNFLNPPNTYNDYQNFVTKWKKNMDEIKENNGGKFPDDVPIAIKEYYNSLY